MFGETYPSTARYAAFDREEWMGLRTIILALLLLGSAVAPGAAQISPADSAAVLLESARTFEAQDRWEIAHALYEFLVERFPETAAGRAARDHLLNVPTSRSSPGRTELTVWSTVYGLWLGGIALPILADVNGPEAPGVGLLLGGPVGFFAGRTLARSRPLTSGQARAITWGGTWGTWQGIGWSLVADFGADEFCDFDVCYESDAEAQYVVGAAIAGGLAGIATGTLLSRKTISDGLATTINFGSLWGTWFGFAGGVLAGLEDDALLAGALLGGNAGLVSTAILGQSWNLSRSRARLISIAGVVGGLGGLGFDLLIQPDDEKVVVLIPLLGSLVGLGVGAARTSDRPRVNGTGSRGPSSALLDWNGGGFDLGAPMPLPRRIPLRDGPGLRTQWTVRWLSARF